MHHHLVTHIKIAPSDKNRGGLSARTAVKIPGALLMAAPEKPAAPKPPPTPKTPKAKKAGRSIGKALVMPFTQGMTYAAGGECPIPIQTPGDARMRPYRSPSIMSDKGKGAEKAAPPEKYESQSPATIKSDEKTPPPEILRTPLHPFAAATSERRGSPLLGVTMPASQSRPESGLLPQPLPVPSDGSDDDKKYPTSIRDSMSTARWSDRTYADSKYSSGSVGRRSHNDETEEHIRELFNALPPEAQALAFARLAEQREREAQLAAKRDRERQWVREEEARLERERREREWARAERAERARAMEQRAQNEAYGGMRDELDNHFYGAQPSGSLTGRTHHAPLPQVPLQRPASGPGESRTARRQGSSSNLRQPQTPRHRDQRRWARAEPTTKEELEAQIAQLLEAQKLPPLPALPRRSDSASDSRAGSPIAQRPPMRTARSSTPNSPPHHNLFPSGPRPLPDSMAPRAALPPRPTHSTRQVSTPPRGGQHTASPPSHLIDLPDILIDLSAPLPQPPTPRRQNTGGDSEVRAALAAKIRALQAALDTLDVEDDSPSTSSNSGISRADPFGPPDSPLPQPPTSMSGRQALSSSPVLGLRGTSYPPSETQTPRAIAPHDALDLELHDAPQAVASRAPPATSNTGPLSLPVLRLPGSLTAEPEGRRREPPVTNSRPSSELVVDDDFHLDVDESAQRALDRRTPPPEYATYEPPSRY